ncbi:MAG: LuxR C-terminal-related transcriptional regulator [Gammaproteobacteria bacterium]
MRPVARIHRRLPDCALPVFTMHAHPTYATQAFEAGARGYVTKASPADELIAAIRAVARGARFLSDDIAQALAIERLDHARSCLDALSPREFEVLRLLVQAHPVAAIAESLHLSPKTVMNLHYAIKRKLEVDTDIELTRLAARLGLIDDA